jgi:hypothetical protein
MTTSLRWLLQALGAGSAALGAFLVAGTLVSATVWADEDGGLGNPAESYNCRNCCGCSGPNTECQYTGIGRDCNHRPCACACQWDQPGQVWWCVYVTPTVDPPGGGGD